MYSNYYKQVAAVVMSLPIAALILFLAIFIGLVFRALVTPKRELDEAANLPLDGGRDDKETP